MPRDHLMGQFLALYAPDFLQRTVLLSTNEFAEI
jgi:hypothetical protein